MGFLCNRKTENKFVSQEAINEQECLRSLGLSNVYNVFQCNNSIINFCSEIFLSPEFYVSGASKLYSGMTTTLTGCTSAYTESVYNLDYKPEFDISFFITGNTNYSAYTGNFCYKIFSKSKFTTDITKTNGLPKGTEYKNICLPYSAITSSTVTEKVLEGSLPKTWDEYMIRPYYDFFTKECEPNLYFNGWNDQIQLNLFNNNTDYYFMTVIKPPAPELAPPPTQILPNYNLIQDNLLVNGKTSRRGKEAIPGNLLNYFILRAQPSDIYGVMLFVNGVKLSYGIDFEVINNGLSSPPTIRFFNDYIIKISDTVVANYLVGSSGGLSRNDYSKFFTNTLQANVVTTDYNPGEFPSSGASINYNTTTGKYEIYLTQPVDSDNAVFLSINGVELIQDVQFYLSISQRNRIILDSSTIINPTDIISILAVSPNLIFGDNDYGSLNTPDFIISWTYPYAIPENVEHRFLVQMADKNDENYNSILFQKIIEPEINQSNYTTTMTNLTLNKYYRFRVLCEATYTGYLDNKVTTCSFSEGIVDTANSKIVNSY